MNNLSHLTNKELIEYYKLYKEGMEQTVRFENIKIYGMDTKFAYHLIRLLDEIEQILTLGDLDLQRAREHMKAVRRGDIPLEEIEKWFAEKEISLEKMYQESKLPWGPDEVKIKTLLMECLEEHYGSMDKCIVIPGKEKQFLEDISTIIDKYRKTL